MMTVIRRREPERKDSFYRVWLKSFTWLMALFFALFILFTTVIIFTRLDKNITTLLERAQSISWEEYNRFFDSSANGLGLLAHLLETGEVSDQSAVMTAMNGQTAFDIWFVTDQSGRVVLSSAEDGVPVLAQLVAAAQPAWQGEGQVAVTEIVGLDDLRSFSPPLADRAIVVGEDATEESYGAMFQIVAVPYWSQSRRMGGALVGAHLLNNDSSIAQRVREEIPDSYSTISARGLRVAGNLLISETPSYFGIGVRQADDLIAAVQQGKRYQGQVNLTNRLVHLVASDPILNTQGEVIGALTTGHPSPGLATLKRDTILYVLLSAAVCLVAVIAASTMASKRLAVPMIKLAKVVKHIDDAEVIRREHIDMFNALPPARTQEIHDLQVGFARATTSLYEKNKEILGYLSQLEVERNRLQVLADQLQEANETLEARVEEKTLELRNAMVDLIESNQLKSKFLANTSHELRTPLNSIIGFSDMLISGIYGEITEQQRKRLQMISESARYLLQLINDLLEVSLMAQGKLSLDRQPVNLHEIIASVLTIIRQDCERNQIRIRTDLADNLPQVCVDPTRIKQVLYNLLSNSVKFTLEGGEIVVTTGVEAGEVTVSIQDTGIGISESDQYLVFDEFYQAEQGVARQNGGFGLGLPLSKKLVELHGGRIVLRSTLGEGTTVTVHLPIDDAGGADCPGTN